MRGYSSAFEMGIGPRRRIIFHKIKGTGTSKFLLVVVLLVILPLSSWVFFPNSPPDLSPSAALANSSSLPLYWNWVGSSPGAEPAEKQPRPVYPYSVIPGGVQNKQELQTALRNDAVVALHYAGFRTQSVQLLRLKTARQVYVSYRIGDRIYWTNKKITLHAGEMLLTDGNHLARTRCGNRIADTPLGPGWPSEPPIETLDRPGVPHSPEAAPVELPAGPLVPYDPTPYLVALNSPGPSGSPEAFLPFIPFFPCCGGGTHPTSGPKSSPPTPIAFPGPNPEPTPWPNPLPQPYPTPVPPPVVTPEPGSILLLLVGVVGLFCLWAARRS
jgi:hypothetical protein